MKPPKFIKNIVNFNEFTPDISVEKLGNTFVSPSINLPWFFPVDTLSPAKTVGKGRTNLAFIAPVIVQTDAETPFVRLNRQSASQLDPTIQVHFDPAAYGITSVANYVMVFSIDSQELSANNFNLWGYAGKGTLVNAGTKTLIGKQTVSLIFTNVPPSQQIAGVLQQTSGGNWLYYLTAIRFLAPASQL